MCTAVELVICNSLCPSLSFFKRKKTKLLGFQVSLNASRRHLDFIIIIIIIIIVVVVVVVIIDLVCYKQQEQQHVKTQASQSKQIT